MIVYNYGSKSLIPLFELDHFLNEIQYCIVNFYLQVNARNKHPYKNAERIHYRLSNLAFITLKLLKSLPLKDNKFQLSESWNEVLIPKVQEEMTIHVIY